MDYYFHRSQLAQETLAAHIQLSLNAYRHFKQLLDVILLHKTNGANDTLDTYQRLQHALVRVKELTQREIDFVEADEQEEEREELERTKQIELLVAKTLKAFDEVQLLLDQGELAAAQQTLENILGDMVDQQFDPLIDAAITDEHSEAEKTERRAVTVTEHSTWIATFVSIGSALFALVIGWVLFRTIRKPMNALVSGVRAVAKGDLSHRIDLKGKRRDEFTYLAYNFNKMTNKLEHQRASLLEAQFELEKKVQARTDELQQANTKLHRIDDIRNQFFADISHELRTPLTVIRGEAEVTLRGHNKEPDEYQTVLHRIIELTVQLAKLVDDLLFVARSESSSVRFNMQPFVLDELMTEVWADAQALGQKKCIVVTLTMNSKQLMVHGDRLRLKQALLIVVDNACRYSNSGSEISLNILKGNGQVMVNIADQGIGINEKELEAVFERFYRGEGAHNMAPSGTGLGLSLAKSIVEAHHGGITLESRLNYGTTVTIQLHLVQFLGSS